MFEGFYQLSADPFRLSPDTRFSFSHRSYRKAMTYMLHALQRAEGYIMITGQPGTGKTTLVNDLISTLNPGQAIVAKLVSTQLTADELLNLVAYSFNLNVDGFGKAKVLVEIERFLKLHHQHGRRPLLIVDEAQDMSDDALEELRLLTNIMVGNHQLLQVFLVGQEQLRDTVNAPALEQLSQRLIAATLLEPLEGDDTEDYIKHRLRRVQWRGDPLISKQAYALIQRCSHGIPRRINQICSRLFLHGCIEEKHRLGLADVQAVVEELRQELLLPADGLASDDVIPWSLEQNEETYEEEPRPSPVTPKAAPSGADPLPAAESAGRRAPAAVPRRPVQGYGEARASVAGSAAPAAARNHQPMLHRDKNAWLLKSLALLAELENHASATARLFEKRIGKLELPAIGRKAVTRLSNLKTLLAGSLGQLLTYSRKLRLSLRRPAFLAELGSHASGAVGLLRNRISKTRPPLAWSRAATALVLISAILVAYLSGGGNEPAGDVPALALKQAAMVRVPESETGEGKAGPVRAEPEVAVLEEWPWAERGNLENESVSVIAGIQQTSVEPAVESRRPPALELASMESPPSASQPAIEDEDTEKTVAPETAEDTDAAENTVRQEPAPAEATSVATAAPQTVRQEPAPAEETTVATAAPPKDHAHSSKAAVPAVVKRSKTVAPPSQAEEIADLLDHGWRALRDDRLLVPENNNAYHYFQRVRKLDPQNSDARSGIDRVVVRYTVLAREALDKNDLKKADQHIARGLSISPDNRALLALRERMHAPPVADAAEQPTEVVLPASEPQPSASEQRSGLFMRVKGFFAGQATSKREDDTDER